MPHGSILGPLLFILFINDLVDYLTDSKIGVSEDHSRIRYASEPPIEHALTLKIELNMVGELLRANKLTLDAGVSEFIIFGSQHKLVQDENVTLNMLGENIVGVTEFKYHGVMLDQYLSCSGHSDHFINKTNKKLGVLMKVRDCLNQSTALTLYKSLVLPHVTIEIRFDVVLLKKTSICCNLSRIVRIILLMTTGEGHIIDIYHEPNLELLTDRRKLHMVYLCHKNIYFDGQASLSGFCNPVLPVKGRATRAVTHCAMNIKTQTNLGKKGISVRGPLTWNLIPGDLKQTYNFTTFRSVISTELIEIVKNHPT